MNDGLETPNSDEGITSIEPGESSSKGEVLESQTDLKHVAEKDLKNALLIWATLHHEWTPELTKRDIAFKSKLDLKEVDRLTSKYCVNSRKVGTKRYVKWNPEYEQPPVDEPEQPPFEKVPEDPKEEGQIYQPHLTNFS